MEENSVLKMFNGILLSIFVFTILMHLNLGADLDCKNLPPRTDQTTCCPIPELITEQNLDKCREFLVEPQNKFVPMANEKRLRRSKKQHLNTAVHNNQNNDTRTNLHHCFINCLLNDTGILANGKLNESILSTHLKKIPPNMADWESVLQNSFKTCSSQAEKLNSTSRFSRDAASTCPTIASDLSACVFMETFMHCPPSVWSKTKECNDFRNHINTCMPKFK